MAVDAMAALASLGHNDPQAASAPVNTSAPKILVATNSDYNTAPLVDAPQPGQLLVRGQEEELGADEVGDGVVDLRAEEHDALLEQAAVHVVGPVGDRRRLREVRREFAGHAVEATAGGRAR